MAEDYAARNKVGKHVVLGDDPVAIALLKSEHHIFRDLFTESEGAKPKRLVEIAREACLRLTVHMTIEEELLYPAIKPATEDEVNHSIVEHGSAKATIAELEQLDGSEELFSAKVHVLGEEVIHHIDEEDEDLFEDAKKAHKDGKVDLDALGEKLRARQAELYDQLTADGEIGATHEADANEVPAA